MKTSAKRLTFLIAWALLQGMVVVLLKSLLNLPKGSIWNDGITGGIVGGGVVLGILLSNTLIGKGSDKPDSKKETHSPFDLPGIKTKASTEDIARALRDSRDR